MRNLHEQKIKFQKTCLKSNCIYKSSAKFNKSTTKLWIKSKIKRETSDLSNMYFINQWL